MNSKGMLAVALFLLGALVVAGQGQGQAPAPGAPAAGAAPAALQTGPGVQAPNDAKYREFFTAKCKNPLLLPRGGGGGRGAAATESGCPSIGLR
jgi:hypothetical protein